MMRAALILACAPFAACVAAPPAAEAPVAASKAPVRVMRADGTPFGFDEGAAARQQADMVCGGKVRSSIYDRYEAGAWVFDGGCA